VAILQHAGWSWSYTRKNSKKLDYLCTTWEWLETFGYLTLLTPYILRSYRIIKIFNGSTVDQQTEPRNWDSLVVKESYLFRIYFLVITCAYLLKVIITYSKQGNVILSDSACGDARPMFWLLLNILEFFFVCYIIFKLRSIRDDYGISRELIAVSAILIIVAVAMFVAYAIKGMDPASWFTTTDSSTFLYYHASFSSFRSLALFFVSIVWPVFQTYYRSFDPPWWSNNNALSSLDTLLKDIVCIPHFRKYLDGQGLSAYIECWVEIALFKDLEGSALHDHAQRIYDTFLNDKAKFGLGVSQWSKNDVRRAFEERTVTKDTFNDVQDQLFEFMNEQFPKFLESEYCLECLRQLEHEDRLRDILVESDMIEP